MKIACFIAMITFFIPGCNTAMSHTDYRYPVYLSKNLSLDPFLVSPINKYDREGFEHQLTSKWATAYTVYAKGNDRNTATTISDCISCLSYENSYSHMAKSYEKIAYQAMTLTCKAIRKALNSRPSIQSYLTDLKLDENFARLAPPAMAIIISNDDERKAKRAISWFEMSNVKSVEPRGKESSIYRDGTGGMQIVSLFARGDFNNDTIEDVMLFVENSLEKGSYASTKVFILTRLDKSKRFELVDSF